MGLNWIIVYIKYIVLPTYLPVNKWYKILTIKKYRYLKSIKYKTLAVPVLKNSNDSNLKLHKD